MALALELQSHGEDVQLLEASTRVGGHVRTIRRDGYTVETGPNTLQVNDPAIEAFLEKHHLLDNAIEANATARKRYIIRGGRPVAVPASPLSGITSPLFSFKAKLKLAQEAFIPQANHPDESLANFVRRRLGQEFLDYAINPMVGGVYAGDPEKLSVKHAFPKVWALEAQSGSLIRGAIAKKKQARRCGNAFKTKLLSWPEGMDTLTRNLSASLNIATGIRITEITSTAQGWRVDWEDAHNGYTKMCKKLIIAVPAFALSGLPFEPVITQALAHLSELYYPPVSMLALGFPHQAIRHALDGFGMLVPEVEGFNILGTLFSSTLFPGRAPEGHALLTTFIGGARQPESARLDTDTIQSLVLKDLDKLLGIQGEPTFVEHAFWPRAIPQYEVGHQKYIDTLESLERSFPNLHFVGNYRHGIAAGKCLSAASDTYTRIFK